MYQKITKYLNTCIEKDMLSHAYVFYGPDEPAKKAVALNFANKILGADSQLHPDLILISADAREERSIDMIRQLKKFLILSPYFGKYKIAIIEAAEKLNAYAQNALLKIFEEAPSTSIIILCAKTIDSIPETISSRGVKLPFWRNGNTLIPSLLADKKIIEIFKKILNEDSKNQYHDIQNLADYKAVEIFQAWLEFLRNNLLSNPSKKSELLLKVSQNIYFKLNETNINPKFAYDELILNL